MSTIDHSVLSLKGQESPPTQLPTLVLPQPRRPPTDLRGVGERKGDERTGEGTWQRLPPSEVDCNHTEARDCTLSREIFASPGFSVPSSLDGGIRAPRRWIKTGASGGTIPPRSTLV